MNDDFEKRLKDLEDRVKGLVPPSLQVEDFNTQVLGNKHFKGTTTFERTSVLSGNSGTHTTMGIGRESIDGSLSVASAAGEYSTDSDAGDIILRNESSSKLIKMQAGAGASVLNISDKDIYTVNWTAYSPTYYGFTADAFDWSGVAYMKLGRMVCLSISFLGTSNQTYMQMSLPYTPDQENSLMIIGWDATAATQVYAHITGSDLTKLYFYQSYFGGVFTNSGKKGAHGTIVYRTAS